MKKFILFFTALLITLATFAQAPQKMSYQTVIRNATDDLVSNTTVGIQISVLQGSASGTAVYVETHAPTTNANGLASLEIGGGTPVTGTHGSHRLGLWSLFREVGGGSLLEERIIP